MCVCVFCSDKGLMLNKSNAPVLKKDTWKIVKKRPLAVEELWDEFRAKAPPPSSKK